MKRGGREGRSKRGGQGGKDKRGKGGSEGRRAPQIEISGYATGKVRLCLILLVLKILDNVSVNFRNYNQTPNDSFLGYAKLVQNFHQHLLITF